jgi:hypothetical protein
VNGFKAKGSNASLQMFKASMRCRFDYTPLPKAVSAAGMACAACKAVNAKRRPARRQQIFRFDPSALVYDVRRYDLAT